jgi:hypothetical protein
MIPDQDLLIFEMGLATDSGQIYGVVIFQETVSQDAFGVKEHYKWPLVQ